MLNNALLLTRKTAIRRFKSLVGCRIWVMSTRLDIIFGVIHLASALLDSIDDVEKMAEFVLLANRVISRAGDKHRSLSFVHFIQEGQGNRKVQIIAFPDAPIGTLRNHGSSEGYCAFLAAPKKRDGSVLREGNLLVFYGREISRVSRSTAHTGGIALRNASGATLYLQCLTEEVISGKFRTSFLRKAEDVVPVISPFRPVSISTSSNSSHGDTKLQREVLHQKDPWNQSVLLAECPKCAKSNETTCSELSTILESVLNVGQIGESEEREAVFALLVFDCANTIALMSRLNPNPIEKVYRLICAYLYDGQRHINFSFTNAPYNFGDIATKHMYNLPIWHSFLKTGMFFI